METLGCTICTFKYTKLISEFFSKGISCANILKSKRVIELLSTMTTARKVTPFNDPVECVDKPLSSTLLLSH